MTFKEQNSSSVASWYCGPVAHLCCRRLDPLLCREMLQGHVEWVCPQVCVPGGPVHSGGLPGLPPVTQGLWGNCQLAHVTYVSLFILGE